MRRIRELIRLKHQAKLSHEALDRPALKPLPVGRYAFARHSTARVSIDHHIAVDVHFRSVPEPLELMARLAALVPRPRMHLTRFHGVFAPHRKRRA